MDLKRDIHNLIQGKLILKMVQAHGVRVKKGYIYLLKLSLRRGIQGFLEKIVPNGRVVYQREKGIVISIRNNINIGNVVLLVYTLKRNGKT